MAEKAVLTIGDRSVELPILDGTEGERAVDVSRLREQTGMIAYDPALANTGMCKSAITFIDGEKGILRYRGIPIEPFTVKPNFTVCFAIGRLPGWIAQWKEQHDDPTSRIVRPRQVYVGPNQTDYVPLQDRPT